jgi:hypothetical protein
MSEGNKTQLDPLLFIIIAAVVGAIVLIGLQPLLPLPIVISIAVFVGVTIPNYLPARRYGGKIRVRIIWLLIIFIASVLTACLGYLLQKWGVI